MADNRIQDEFELLEKMIKDMRSTHSFYRPTNYWQTYEAGSIDYLKTYGLRDFRSYNTSRLASFAAGTYRGAPLLNRYRKLIEYRGFRESPLMTIIFEIYTRILNRFGKRFDLINIKKFSLYEEYYLQEILELQNLQYRQCKLLDRISGLNILDRIEDSAVGNPCDLFRINARYYTVAFLRYFEQMAYISMNIDFNKTNSVIEIGSGYGGCVEVFVKAFPRITYFNFDIPPQVYVAQQYLSAIFPGQVYTYKNLLSNEKIDIKKYLIICLPTWALELMSGINFDLFINSASFQEMEQDVVENYYSLIKDKVKWAYLFELTQGSYRKTSEISGGCIEPLKISDLISIFKDFEIMAQDEFYRIEHPHTQLILKRMEQK